MNNMKPRVLSIGYGRHFFTGPSLERSRMEACALRTEHIDMIIFTHRRDGYVTTKLSDKLTLHPTRSHLSILMPFDAWLLGRKLLRQYRQSAVITTQDPFETALVGLALKYLFKVRVIIQEHGDFFGHPYWKNESILNRVRSWWGTYALKKADKVRTVSKRAEDHLRAIGVKEIDVLPVAIDPEPFRRVSKVEGEKASFVFLSVARFVPQKNLHILLEAFAVVHKTRQEARLVLVGDGPEKKSLEKKIKELFPHNSPVSILPWSDSVPVLMKSADVYVLSSNYEGWGRVLVEAVVSGLPVVTTEVGCAGEVIKDGEHGRVVPVGDVRAFSQAMGQLIVDEAFYQHCREGVQKIATTIEGIDTESYAKKWVTVLSQ